MIGSHTHVTVHVIKLNDVISVRYVSVVVFFFFAVTSRKSDDATYTEMIFLNFINSQGADK